MSDIFQIKGVNSFLKIGETEYRFADPNFKAKVLLMRKFEDLNKAYKSNAMPIDEYLLKTHDLNTEQIKLFLPDMPESEIEKLGEFAFTALLTKIAQLTEHTFGAIVEKVEKK